MTEPLRPAEGDSGVWRTSGMMRCPACDYGMDALGLDRPGPCPRPEAGDYTVCLRCGEVAVITIHPLLGASLREATTTELARFAANPENTAAVRRLHAFNATHPRKG